MRFPLFACFFLVFTLTPLFPQYGEDATEPFWRQALGGEVLSLPSYQAQSAVVALDGGNIRAYSSSGTPMWNFFPGGRISPYITRSREGTSYLARTNGTLIAVNRAGRELWRRGLGSPLSAGVVFGWDGRLFVPAGRTIQCFTASGNLLWTKTLDAPFLTPPKADRDGGIIYSLTDNNVYRVDAFGNTHTWATSKTPAALFSLKQDSNNHHNVIVLYKDGTIEDLTNPEEWFPSELRAGPLAAVSRDGKIAVTMDDGQVAVLSMKEKKVLWTGVSHIKEMINNGGNPELAAEMLFDERGIYILSKDGATGFADDGRRLWVTYLNNAAAIPAFGNDGVLYSGGMDWILYAYKIENRALPEHGPLYGSAPEGSYGLGRLRVFDAYDIPLNEGEIKARLNQINAAINSGMVGSNEPVWTSFLLSVSSGRHPVQLKTGALNLLGKLGSQEIVPWLINIFRHDREPALKAAAVLAIGDIGVDPDGIALQAFSFSVINSQPGDEQVLAAVASATGAICRFSGPPLSETGIRILTMLCAATQPLYARRQAERELASLR